jgi:hypothetical protein
MKKAIWLLLMSVIFTAFTAINVAAYQRSDVSVVYNDNVLTFNPPPVVKDGFIFFPIEDLLSGIGVGYIWDGANFSVIGELGGNRIEIPLRDLSYNVNGERLSVQRELLPFVSNERTYVYLDYIVQGFGIEVEWDGRTNTIYLSMPEPIFAEIPVTLHGELIHLERSPVMLSGVAFFPIEELLNSLGVATRWDAATPTFFATYDGKTIGVSLANMTYSINGEILDIPANQSPFILENVLYAHLDQVALGLGIIPRWNTRTNSVNLLDLSERAVRANMRALHSQYPPNMRWTEDNYYQWNGGIWDGANACTGFAFLLSDAAFGDLRARMHTNFDNIRVGDILALDYGTHRHAVIVIGIHKPSEMFFIAEGNFNSVISWTRALNLNHIKGRGMYVLTRYPE